MRVVNHPVLRYGQAPVGLTALSEPPWGQGLSLWPLSRECSG